MRVGACACVLALALVLASCSSSKKHPAAGSTTTTTPKVLGVRTAILRVGKVDIETVGTKNIPIDPATGKLILGLAQKYVTNAVIVPLSQGVVGGNFNDLFDAGVKTLATTTDKAALTDHDVGKVASFTPKATPVVLSALEDGFGQLMYIATDFDLTVKAQAPSGPLTITHHVELTFAQTNKQWLVTAYRVQTVRKSGTTTTTTKATGGTKP